MYYVPRGLSRATVVSLPLISGEIRISVTRTIVVFPGTMVSYIWFSAGILSTREAVEKVYAG